MEFCENGELLVFVKDFRERTLNAYPFIQKIRLITECVLALEYLHGKNVIHRDLKSENVLICENESAKLMDFGLSRCVDTMSVLKTQRIGTNIYMAPEIVTTDRYDEKCDIFSLAIMMYIVLTEEEHPYEGLVSDEYAIELKVSGDKNFRPKLDRLKDTVDEDEFDWIKELIERCWSHEASDRPSCSEVREILEEKGSLEKFKKNHLMSADEKDVKSSGTLSSNYMEKGLERKNEEKNDVIKMDERFESINQLNWKELAVKFIEVNDRVKELEEENKRLRN